MAPKLEVELGHVAGGEGHRGGGRLLASSRSRGCRRVRRDDRAAVLAVSIGNVHGTTPRSRASTGPGSIASARRSICPSRCTVRRGCLDADVERAVAAGICKVNVNTRSASARSPSSSGRCPSSPPARAIFDLDASVVAAVAEVVHSEAPTCSPAPGRVADGTGRKGGCGRPSYCIPVMMPTEICRDRRHARRRGPRRRRRFRRLDHVAVLVRDNRQGARRLLGQARAGGRSRRRPRCPARQADLSRCGNAYVQLVEPLDSSTRSSLAARVGQARECITLLRRRQRRGCGQRPQRS